ncbi:MAG TPA: MFS transporter [Dehalococcoidia bacterium]|nr:MFS transporter [Dehalococcoidia bacterium]
MAEAKVDEGAGVTPGRPRGGGLTLATFVAFREPSFSLLWVNTFSFALVQGIQRFAFVWLALELSEGNRALGLVSFALGIPVLFISIPAGVLSDRVDRRQLLFGSQLLILLVTAVAAVFIFVDLMSVAAATGLALVVGVGIALGMPVRQAIVPSIVPPERLMNAITLNSLGMNVSQMIGPAIGGASIAIWGIGGCFVVQTVLLLASMFTLLPLRVPPPAGAAQEARSLRGNIAEGFGFVVKTGGIRVLFLLLLVMALFITGPWQALLPKIANDKLGAEAFGAAMLFAAFGTGMIAGSLALASIPELRNAGGWFVFTMVCGGVFVAAVGLSEFYSVTIVLMLLGGIVAGFFMNLNLTLIQSHTPAPVMGRVMAIYTLSFMGGAPFGALLAGGAADLIGPGEWFAVCGAITAVTALTVLLTQPGIRRLSSNPGDS